MCVCVCVCVCACVCVSGSVTTTLHPVYTVWQQNGTDGDFALQAEINYTEQTLLYPSITIHTNKLKG